MSIAAVSIKRPVATMMVYLIVITLGLVSFRFLPVDLLPPIEFPSLNIRVNYGNVGPEEMELIITERIENLSLADPLILLAPASDQAFEAHISWSEGAELGLSFVRPVDLHTPASEGEKAARRLWIERRAR